MTCSSVAPSEDIRALIDLAEAHDWERGIALGAAWLGLKPDDWRTAVRLASLLNERRETEAADFYLREALAKWPNEVWLKREYALLADAHLPFSFAETRWRELEFEHPDSPLGLCGRAELHRKNQRETDAARIYGEAVERFPDYIWAAHGHAWSATLARDWAEATRRWSDVRTRFPEHSYAHGNLVEALIEEGKVQAALDSAREGLERFPDDTALVEAAARLEFGAALRQKISDVRVTLAALAVGRDLVNHEGVSTLQRFDGDPEA